MRATTPSRKNSRQTEKVLCRTPTQGKKPTSIAREKFDPIRRAILKVLKANGAGTLFVDLPELVEEELSPTERNIVGSLPWIVTTVKLELEVRGEIRRLSGSPQRLLKATSKST
jgi:hypothetical protein